MSNLPITPLGKALSQGPVPNANAPLNPAAQLGQAPTISAFEWFSLARGAWMWIIRPIWYLCVVFPFKLGSTMARQSNDAFDRGREIDVGKRNNYFK
ncbi:hypothetical protein [Achromobacter kerstersii]|uniref:hypothetical protein n=1 Tax=Achromobacter kerstersii TaxID=1353890 RepID=UPI0006C2ABE1|nr:hypothetical protein [Achromobacter kerstersii]CUJ49729.1 Uncharacterised protein [Achromobacter kerstersii]